MVSEDIDKVAGVHKAAFLRQTMSREWISASFYAYPKTQTYVAEIDNSVVGYILWTQKSGFRPEIVLELEQIAVLPGFRGQGIGSALIENSLLKVREQVNERNATIKHILVTTRADNQAQQLFKQSLGVKTEATLLKLYSADEVILIKRNIDREA